MKNGEISEILVDPNSIGKMQKNLRLLIGNDAKFNADKMIEIFKGKDNDFSKAVCLNAAAGLIVAEKFVDFKEAYKTQDNSYFIW